LSSLAHELVHWLQHCQTTAPPQFDDNDIDHANWRYDGITDMLNEIFVEGLHENED